MTQPAIQLLTRSATITVGGLNADGSQVLLTGTNNVNTLQGAARSGDFVFFNSGTINLGAGIDTLTLGNFTNSLTIAGIETLVGGSGADAATCAEAGSASPNPSVCGAATGPGVCSGVGGWGAGVRRGGGASLSRSNSAGRALKTS